MLICSSIWVKQGSLKSFKKWWKRVALEKKCGVGVRSKASSVLPSCIELLINEYHVVHCMPRYLYTRYMINQ